MPSACPWNYCPNAIFFLMIVALRFTYEWVRPSKSQSATKPWALSLPTCQSEDGSLSNERHASTKISTQCASILWKTHGCSNQLGLMYFGEGGCHLSFRSNPRHRRQPIITDQALTPYFPKSVKGFRCQRGRWPEKRPVWSKIETFKIRQK